ncbi:MAG: TRAP transporter substrate-binding protein [Deltaproteobacteria bacterium]|nr:TRAP transporter substrate-binding protein [Deltaproteobacteria bacterium]
MEKTFFRSVIFILIFVVCIFFSGFVSLAAEPVKTIRIGSILPKNNPLTPVVYKLRDMVSNRTKGRIKIVYHPNSELGSAVEQISGVRMGTQEVWLGSNGQMARLLSTFQLLNPAFAYKDKADKKAFLDSPFFSQMREELRKKFGVVMLSHDWFRGYRNILTKKPVRKLDDLKGIKLRVPRSQAKLFSWKTFGASPTPTSAAEIYMSLREGVIEGVEYNLFVFHYDHFDEICKYCTLTNHDASYNSLLINQKIWNSIQKGDREIILDAISECSKWHEERMNQLTEEIKNAMNKEQNVTFINLAPEERIKFVRAGQKVFDELEMTKKWWPKCTVEKIRAKDPQYYRP